MHVIEATNEKGWRWISGIFSDRAEAEFFYRSIPADERKSQAIVEIPPAGYPFFVIESEKFSYGDIAGVITALDALRPVGNEDAILLNIFVVEEDFRPPKPGADHMGALEHYHITDSTLKPRQRAKFIKQLRESVSQAKS